MSTISSGHEDQMDLIHTRTASALGSVCGPRAPRDWTNRDKGFIMPPPNTLNTPQTPSIPPNTPQSTKLLPIL